MGMLDQYGAGPFKRQQFGTAGDEGVNHPTWTTRFKENASNAMTLFAARCLLANWQGQSQGVLARRASHRVYSQCGMVCEARHDAVSWLAAG